MMMNLAESQMSSQSAFGSGSGSKKCLCQLVEQKQEHATSGSHPKQSKADLVASQQLTSSISDPYSMRCPVCVQRQLKAYVERRNKAISEHAQAREECAQHLLTESANTKTATTSNRNNLSELELESQQLRDRLSMLRKHCADMAVRVASQAVENDDRRQLVMDPTGEFNRNLLIRMEESLLNGSMSQAHADAASQVRVLRFQWARIALTMHRLDVDHEDTKLRSPHSQQQPQQQQQRRRARGIGKIGGLPLPHAGPELYGVLPPKELQSALRLVASVTSTVARCLGIILPHPILLTPNGSTGDITDTVEDTSALRSQELLDSTTEQHRQQHPPHSHNHHVNDPHQLYQHHQHQQQQPQQQPQTFGASSTASLLSLMDGSSWKRSAKNVLKRATGQTRIEISSPNAVMPPSMDAELVSQRIHHATAAVIAEDQHPSSSKFALSAEVMHQEGFAIALQLLQNNVIVLCIRAGVPVAKLWPAEAVLLNLYALSEYCAEQTAAPY